MTRNILLTAVAAITALFFLIQLVPYGVTNPPVVQQPQWDSPQTEALARRACFDCHSNEVVKPWYGNIAPVAWGMARHVEEGRMAVNFSEMNRPQEEAHECGEEVEEGEMPPAYYLAMHPEARLTADEKQQLISGLNATFGGEEGEHEEGEHGHHDEEREHDDD